MVMIVSNPVLVAGNRSCGLYPTGGSQRKPQVCRTRPDGRSIPACCERLGDVLSGDVWVASHGFHHGDALSGDLEALLSQLVGEIDGVRVVHEKKPEILTRSRTCKSFFDKSAEALPPQERQELCRGTGDDQDRRRAIRPWPSTARPMTAAVCPSATRLATTSSAASGSTPKTRPPDVWASRGS